MVKDKIHDAVKNALIKDEWRILHDPLVIKYGDDRVYADLAAEKHLVAEQNGQKIVVEIKSFSSLSPIHDFKQALGQYQLYLTLLNELMPDHKLYLAVSESTYRQTFQNDIIQFVTAQNKIPLIVVNIKKEVIVQWIEP